MRKFEVDRTAYTVGQGTAHFFPITSNGALLAMLVQAVKAAGSQEAFANDIGLEAGQSAISKMLRGKTRITPRVLKHLGYRRSGGNFVAIKGIELGKVELS